MYRSASANQRASVCQEAGAAAAEMPLRAVSFESAFGRLSGVWSFKVEVGLCNKTDHLFRKLCVCKIINYNCC